MNLSSISIDDIRTSLPSSFTIERSIAAGGQGAVYLGTVNGQQSAVKIFSADANLTRLEREIASLQSIDCPNLVRVLAVDEVLLLGLPHKIVGYEYHPGGDLQEWIKSKRVVTCDELIEVGTHICAAIEELWKKRIVHRDIKPANIVVASDGRYVLVDVGLARHLDLSHLTTAGFNPGTNGFKSPEQAKGRQNLTRQSDVYSLGVTLYQLAALQHPLVNPFVPTSPVVPLLKHRQDLPLMLVRQIDRMLSLSPNDRPTGTRAEFERIAQQVSKNP